MADVERCVSCGSMIPEGRQVCPQCQKGVPIMNGSGCKTCPVINCETLNYRGSTCAAQRAKLGLGDPMTFADKIRNMSDEELTAAIYQLIYAKDPAMWFCKGKKECGDLMDNNQDIPDEMCLECLLKKLQQPAEEG